MPLRSAATPPTRRPTPLLLVLLLLLGTLLPAAPLTPIVHAADPTFATRRPFGTGRDDTFSVAVGDLNGDGYLDIVTGNDGQQNVVYLNDGAGNFSSARPFGPNSGSTWSVAVGDLNGDGYLDIVTGNLGQNVVYLNDGAGNFSSARLFGTASNDTRSVAVGDLNGDGYLDLVAGNLGQQNVVYLNDGTGNFSSVRPFGPNSGSTWSVAVGDLNGDGYLDLVTGNLGQNVVYLNDGAGNFSSARLFGTASNDTRSVEVGDLNGDGYLDLVTGNDRQQNVVYLNDGAGNFSSARPFGTGSYYTPIMAVGDLNGDGYLDLVTGNLGQNVVYLNDGAGNFSSVRPFGPNSGSTRSVAVGDLNGDGYLDLVTGNFGQNVVYLNDGAGNFSSARPFGTASDGTQSVAVGDLNGDGYLDLVAGNLGQQNVVYLNDGAGNFSSVRPFGPNPSTTRSVAVGDLNGDGYLDIVTGNYGQNVVYLNDRAGNFSSARPFGTASDDTFSVAVGDLNGDGYLDLVAGNLGQQNVVYLNDGAGNFSSARPFGPNSGSTWRVAVGDLNGDGYLDIVTGNYGQQNVVYLNDGASNFSSARPFGTVSDDTRSVAVGDLNGDGYLDLVTGDFEQNVVYLNDGTGNFSSVRPFGPNSGSTRSVAVGDLNGDGYLDLVTGNFGQNVVYLNDGAGNFSSARLFGTASNDTQSVAVGDLNGDGYLDLVTVNYGQQNVVYLNDGFSGSFLPNNPPSVTVTRPGATSNANFYSTPQVLGDPVIAIPYTLFDPEGDPVRAISTTFSLDGGDNWRPAIAATVPLTPDLQTARALRFDGADDYVSVAAPSVPLGNSAYTIEAWVKPSTMGVHGIVGWGNFGANNQVNALRLTDTGLIHYWWGNDLSVTLTRPITGTWHHVAASFDGTTRRILLDGAVVASDTPTGHAVPSGSNFRIGSTNLGDYFAGGIDEVRIWNVARTPEQIQAALHRTLRGSEAGLVGYWRLDEGSGTTVADSTANHRTGILGGSAASRPAWGRGAPVALPHVFKWDTFASEVFGQSDNVVFRIMAYPNQRPQPGGVPGPFQHPYSAATTFPFRLRGTQVRVVNPQGQPAPGAVVFRLNAALSRNRQLFAPNPTAPAFTTGANGYLRGRGQITPGDQLIALAPVPLPRPYANAYSDTVRLYHTNIVTTTAGVAGFMVQSSGVQTVTVSAARPLALFDLTVSLEWDARNDARFMAQLEGDLARASELLFQASHGQAALGSVTIFHDKENWDYAHIRVYASNRVRPSALVGGVATMPITDPTTLSTMVYGPGQLKMGAVWNRFGTTSGNLSEDWPRTLVHELGHYLFFLEDNYIGLDTQGQIIPVTSCPGLMSDPYASSFQFQTAASWLPGCARTFSNQSTGRADWTTLTTFYPALRAPSLPLSQLPPGPARLPLALTEIASVDPLTPTVHLDVPIFYTVDQATSGRYLPSLTARAYLFQNISGDLNRPFDRLTALGRANNDQVLARGARVGDRLCLFEPSAARFGCTTIQPGQERLPLVSSPSWQPDIQVTPVTSRTLTVQVSAVPAQGVGLRAELYPLNELPMPAPVTLTARGNGVYSGTFQLAEPVEGAYLHVATTEPTPRWESVTSFALGGNAGGYNRTGGGYNRTGGGYNRTGGGYNRTGGGYNRTGGGYNRTGGDFARIGGAPVTSAEGDVLLVGDNLTFAVGQFLLLQTTSSLPSPPPWASLIGQGYRFTSSPSAPDLTGTALSFSYLDSEVPPGEEANIQVYYRSPSATNWRALTTTLDTYANVASIPNQGVGLYALMTSVRVRLANGGWNNFSYPVAGSRTVGEALASIEGKYTVVYSYVPTDTLDPWKVYAPPPAPSWVNDLERLEFGQGYWIYTTQPTDLLLNGGSMGSLASAQASSAGEATAIALSAPPATIYGVLVPKGSFVPAPGQVVEARIDGASCGRATTRPVAGQVTFVVKVAAVGLETPACGLPGRKVSITVAEQAVGTTVWDNTRVLDIAGAVRVYLPLLRR